MRLLSNNCPNSHFFIINAIQQKRNSIMYLGTHEKDYDESVNGGIYHTDVVHENMHEETWAGYVDINKLYTDNGWKEEPKSNW